MEPRGETLLDAEAFEAETPEEDAGEDATDVAGGVGPIARRLGGMPEIPSKDAGHTGPCGRWDDEKDEKRRGRMDAGKGRHDGIHGAAGTVAEVALLASADKSPGDHRDDAASHTGTKVEEHKGGGTREREYGRRHKGERDHVEQKVVEPLV